MITKLQAMTASEFHEDHPAGGKVTRWRRNGRTQTWVTRPRQFRVPVKHGLYGYGQIRNGDAGHAITSCPDARCHSCGAPGEPAILIAGGELAGLCASCAGKKDFDGWCILVDSEGSPVAVRDGALAAELVRAEAARVSS